mmetsp:Transcript_56483/g.138636  ORF Transcript_56483/g.138636 Transcript_56483/m.138636 type:complete len:343 (+) Transcript_56483:559-1587(+)
MLRCRSTASSSRRSPSRLRRSMSRRLRCPTRRLSTRTCRSPSRSPLRRLWRRLWSRRCPLRRSRSRRCPCPWSASLCRRYPCTLTASSRRLSTRTSLWTASRSRRCLCPWRRLLSRRSRCPSRGSWTASSRSPSTRSSTRIVSCTRTRSCTRTVSLRCPSRLLCTRTASGRGLSLTGRSARSGTPLLGRLDTALRARARTRQHTLASTARWAPCTHPRATQNGTWEDLASPMAAVPRTMAVPATRAATSRAVPPRTRAVRCTEERGSLVAGRGTPGHTPRHRRDMTATLLDLRGRVMGCEGRKWMNQAIMRRPRLRWQRSAPWPDRGRLPTGRRRVYRPVSS